MSSDYRAYRTLPVRVELLRQLRRRRTAVSYGLMFVLPLIVVAAVKYGPSSSGGGGGSAEANFGSGSLNLIGLATTGAWNFTLVMLFFGSGFLLTTLVSMFFGDTVASEASWSTLRYLLAAPVPRRRLLRNKLIVAFWLSLFGVALLTVASFFIGWWAFGNQALVSPFGGSFDTIDAAQRLALIAGYVFVTLLFAAGVAFLIGVLTDVPLGAVGTAVILVIVLQILDAIEALGSIREWLPGHYARAWTDALATSIDWSNMARGAAYSFGWFVLLLGWAFLKFDRKDILS